MPTIIVSDEQKPYIKPIQQFLDMMGQEKITAVACVALVDDDDVFDVTTCWNISAYEKMTCANVLIADAIWDIVKLRLEDEGFNFTDKGEET